MTDDRSLERAARSWLEEGPTQAPDRAVEAALLRIGSTPQERDLRIPWRLSKMINPARIAAAAVIAVLAVGGAFMILRPSQSSVGAPSPSPSASAGAVASAAATPRTSPITVPALTQTFTSPRNGFSVKYPTGWTIIPATQSWAAGTSTDWGNPALDAIKTSDVRLVVASQRLASGQTPDAWLTAYCKTGGTSASSCGPQIKIGGETGYVDLDGEPAVGGAIVAGGVIFDAAVVVGGRGYVITMDGILDRAYFQAFLDTVSFDAPSAVDPPKALTSATASATS